MEEKVPCWKRAVLIDKAVDHFDVAEAAAKGPLQAMEVVAVRCERLGVQDATVGEVVRSWKAVMGEAPRDSS